MTPQTNRQLTRIAVVTAAVTTFAAVATGHTQFAINLTLGLAGLAVGLSVGFAIRKWRGDR
jgi:hypothetical protein